MDARNENGATRVAHGDGDYTREMYTTRDVFVGGHVAVYLG